MTALAAPRARRDVAWIAHSGLAAWVIVAALIVGLTIKDPAGFWGAPNIANVLTTCVVLGLVAIGQNVVVLTGGIDLSVGSTATLSGLLAAILIDGYPIRTLPVVLLMLGLGAVVGVGHGLLVARVEAAAVRGHAGHVLRAAGARVHDHHPAQGPDHHRALGLRAAAHRAVPARSGRRC